LYFFTAVKSVSEHAAGQVLIAKMEKKLEMFLAAFFNESFGAQTPYDDLSPEL
jgi:hypothetical protein